MMALSISKATITTPRTNSAIRMPSAKDTMPMASNNKNMIRMVNSSKDTIRTVNNSRDTNLMANNRDTNHTPTTGTRTNSNRIPQLDP